MFGLRSGRKQRPSSRQVRLAVENLESRLCPTAPVVTLNVTMLTGTMVRLTGQVTDENPTACTVFFGGVVGGYVAPDSNGDYSYETDASLGQATASAIDDEELLSNEATANVTSNVPSFITFEAIQLGGDVWLFRGRVSDESREGLTVYFGGLPSLLGASTTTDEDGFFAIAVMLGEGESGTATAEVSDPFGQAATQGTFTIP